jgi:acetyl-CoA acyltransferase
MRARYGVDAMPETAENVAEVFQISRADQDAFAFRSQMRARDAAAAGRFAVEIVAVDVPATKGEARRFSADEHPRADTTLEKLARLPTPFRTGGTVTAGNASGVNDGAAAMLIASAEAVERHDLKPLARILGAAVTGVEPRLMGFGPAPASRKLLARLGLKVGNIDVIELNEAFASQALAVTRDLGLADDAGEVNPNGGAIALGHPLGMSGARLAGTAAHELQRRRARYALCTMCIGVGQGIALVLERAQ